MSYTKTTWVNNQAPAINADNLNHMEQGIESAHNQIDINTSDIDSLETQVQTNTQNIASETSARQSTDTSLQTQIDQLIAPSGEAPSAAEIENARIGAPPESTVYPTLGDAIRGQVTDLKSALTNAENILDTANIVKSNAAIYIASGYNFLDDIASTTRVSTKAIYVPSGETLKVLASGFDKCTFTTSTDGSTVAQNASFVTTPSFNHEFVGPIWFRLVFANTDDSTISPNDVSITVHNKIDELDSTVGLKLNKGASVTQIPFTLKKGKYINGSGTEASNSIYCYVEGDLTGISGYLRVYSTAGSGNARYAFYDSNDVLIKIQTQSGSPVFTLEDVIIPNNAAKVKANGFINGSPRSIPKVCSVEYPSTLINSNGGEFTNLLVPNEFTDIEYSWQDGGFGYTDSAYVASETAKFMAINVVEGEYYRITGNSYYSYNLIGFVSESSTTWMPNASNAKYFDTIIQVPKNVIGLVIHKKNTETVTIKKATGYADGRIFLGKKIAIIGDSTIERSTSVPQKWHDNISLMTGLEVINLGISGTGYKKGQASNKAYYQRLSSVPADVDAVIIFGSGNDNDQTVGVVSDTTTDTVCGCVNKTINDLIALYPTKKIGVITAYPWASFKPERDTAMRTIANDIVEICRNNSIPVLDLFHCSNLRPWIEANNTALFLNADGIHINNDGHALITPMMLEFIKTLLFGY